MTLAVARARRLRAAPAHCAARARICSGLNPAINPSLTTCERAWTLELRGNERRGEVSAIRESVAPREVWADNSVKPRPAR
jgi:hypothetical protein